MRRAKPQDEHNAALCKVAAPGLLTGLSGRILALTVAIIIFSEVVFFVPSLASMRLRWLDNHLSTAAAAAVVIDGLQPQALPRALENDTLMATGTKAIVLRKDGISQLLAMTDMPPEISNSYDLTNVGPVDAVVDAFDELLFGGGRTIRVFGYVGDTDAIIELVISDDELRQALWTFSRNIFFLTILLATFTAMLIFFWLNSTLVRPLRRQIANMLAFSDKPDLPENVFQPSSSTDELGIAGRHLSAMQTELQKTLRQQKRLAELGLAVSKINHDMRNILASAQLMSDRIAGIDDPVVRRVAPKLLRAIDRAASYSRTVLSYGQISEEDPKRKMINLFELINDVHDYLDISADVPIDWINRVPEDLHVDADPEQFFRVVFNLCRNSVQALSQQASERRDSLNCLIVSAQRHGSVVSLSIDDTGPGMPQKARENLFAAFRGGVRSGGTGLGLAIARELVLAHGGTIALVEKAGQGTQFRIEVPDRPVVLESWRSEQEKGS